MAAKKQMKHRGAARPIYDYVRKTYGVGEVFSTSNIDGFPEPVIASSLNYLCKKGMLRHGAIRNTFMLAPNGAAINPAQAIYDLLDFMAKAEAPLRRAAKILEAVEGVK